MPEYANSSITSFTANVSVGANTTIFTGIFNLEDKSKVAYEAQFANNDPNPLSFAHFKFTSAQAGNFGGYIKSLNPASTKPGEGYELPNASAAAGSLTSLLAASYNGSNAPLKNNVLVVDRDFIPA